jgi:putative oxidoreductase
MKTAALIARYLLGLTFLTFGLNGFFHFIPQGPMPLGLAGQFVGALIGSHYMVFVFLIQIVAAVLLLIDKYVPLALTLLAPVIVNILLFHTLMSPTGLGLAILVAILWILVAASFRSAFEGILQHQVAAK